MARARWLKPEFFTDRKIGALGAVPALVFQALWVTADDGGVAACDPDRMKGKSFYVWPSISESDIAQALAALEDSGRIVRYRSGDDGYAQIVNWRHQGKIHKASKFRHPPPAQGVTGNTPALVPGAPQTLPPSPPPIYLYTHTPTGGGGAGTVPEYFTHCVVALNAGMKANSRVGPTFREISTSTQMHTVTWQTDGIPLPVVVAVIRDLTAAFAPKPHDRQIKSLRYFDAAVRERWAGHQAEGLASVPDPVRASFLRKQGYPV